MPRRSSGVSQNLFYLYLLGSPRIAIHEQTIPLLSRPAITLLGYLALQPATGRSATRSRLAGILFPEETETHARRLLSETLYRLRRVLGKDADLILDSGEDFISLGSVWVDVDEFRKYVSSSALTDHRVALDLYTGDLLEDLDADWVFGPRMRLRELFLEMLEQTCLAYIEKNDLSTALQYAHRWTLADPLREEAHRTVMQLYARLGRYAAALQQFSHLSRMLADELQVEPLAETRALAVSIRAELVERMQPTRQTLFIGRRRERMALLEAVDKAHTDHGQLILLEGEPGIGKTRLMEEVAESAKWRRVNVIWGHTSHRDRTTPYAPLIAALSEFLVGPRADQVRTRLSRLTTQTLSPLFSSFRNTRPISLSTETKFDLVPALTDYVRAVANINPCVIILDDVQWASTSFWQVIPRLIQQTGDCRVLWVISYRTDELRADTFAWETLRFLDRQIAPLKIMLDGLSPAECAELAREFGYSLDVREAGQWYTRTHGNPLFLHDSLTQNQLYATSFQAVLNERLTLLPASAHKALEAGAVLGREFTHARWQAITSMDLLEVIPTLLEACLIRESERGYIFEHDLIQEYVYQQIPPDSLVDLHRSTAKTLIQENAKPGEIAWHFEQAKIWPEAICYYYGAGDLAMKTFAYSAALEHYTHALDLLTYLVQPKVVRLALLCRRQHTLGLLLKMSEWRRDVEEIEQLAAELNDSSAQLDALEARLNIQTIDANFEGVQNTASTAMTLAHKLGKVSIEARIARTIGKYLRIQVGRITESLPYLQYAADLADNLHDFPLLTSVLCTLSASQVLTGQCSKANVSAARALAIIEQHPELHLLRPEALQQLGQVAIFQAEWESAHSILQKVMQEQLTLGKLREMGEAAYLFVMVCAEMGQFERGLQTIQFILNIAEQIQVDLEHSDNVLMFRLLEVYTHLMAGEPSEAQRVLEALLKLHIPTGPRSFVQTQFVQGALYLEQGHPERAVLFLGPGIESASPAPIGETIIGLLAYALATHQIGDFIKAEASLARAEQILAASDISRFNVLLYYTRYQVYGRIPDLKAAHEEIDRQSALIRDDHLRTDFRQVYWNRQVETHWQALQTRPAVITVWLARVDAALGKALTVADRVQVQWTIDDGAPDANILNREGKTALRLHRLLRLITESKAQGGLPTDADLAHALGVAERTIERDIKILAARGKSVPTRRRKVDMS